jgi:hypothetical protein
MHVISGRHLASPPEQSKMRRSRWLGAIQFLVPVDASVEVTRTPKVSGRFQLGEVEVVEAEAF